MRRKNKRKSENERERERKCAHTNKDTTCYRKTTLPKPQINLVLLHSKILC